MGNVLIAVGKSSGSKDEPEYLTEKVYIVPLTADWSKPSPVTIIDEVIPQSCAIYSVLNFVPVVTVLLIFSPPGRVITTVAVPTVVVSVVVGAWVVVGFVVVGFTVVCAVVVDFVVVTLAVVVPELFSPPLDVCFFVVVGAAVAFFSVVVSLVVVCLTVVACTVVLP